MNFKKLIRLIFLIAFFFSTLISTLVITATPTSAQGFSVSFGDLEVQVHPGETIQVEFLVSNQSNDEKVIRIYYGDWVRVEGDVTKYELTEEGGLELRSCREWMTFSPDQMVLEPNESREVFCEVTFPDDEALEGSYWGVVFVEEVPPIDPVDERENNGAMEVGIRTIFRYAVKIYTTFEGTEMVDVSFTELLMAQADSGYDIRAIFENSGNIYLRPEVWLEVRDVAGEVLYQQVHNVRTILPESTFEYQFDLRDLQLPPGTYLMLVIADYGGPALVAAQGRMELVAEPDGSADQ